MLLGLVGVVIFAASLPLTRYLTGDLSSWDIGLSRGLIASAAAGLVLLFLRKPLPNRQQAKQILLASTGIVFGFPILTAVGMQYAPANHGAVILGGMPLVTAIIGALRSQERPSLAFWLISVLGLALVVSYAVIEGGVDQGLYFGDVALIVAVIFAGLGYAIGGKVSAEIGGIQVICWILVLSLPVQIIVSAVMISPEAFLVLSAYGWYALILLSLGCSLIGFFFWYGGMKQAGVVRVSQLQYAQPFLTACIAAVFLGESITLLTIGFMVAIVGVIALSRKVY